MQPIGSGHQIKPAPSTLLEPHIHSGLALVHAGDAVIEDVLGRRPRSLVEDSGQIAAQDLNLAAGESIRHACDLVVIPIHNCDRADARLQPLHFRQQSHAFQHANGGSTKIDRIATRTHRGRALHNRWLKSIPAKPVGQCRTRSLLKSEHFDFS